MMTLEFLFTTGIGTEVASFLAFGDIVCLMNCQKSMRNMLRDINYNFRRNLSYNGTIVEFLHFLDKYNICLSGLNCTKFSMAGNPEDYEISFNTRV